MPAYTKLPVTIEARQFERPSQGAAIAMWCGGTNENSPDAIDIATLEGVMRADLGDYVIRGVKGEFYPCKPDIFEATYSSGPPLLDRIRRNLELNGSMVLVAGPQGAGYAAATCWGDDGVGNEVYDTGCMQPYMTLEGAIEAALAEVGL